MSSPPPRPVKVSPLGSWEDKTDFEIGLESVKEMRKARYWILGLLPVGAFFWLIWYFQPQVLRSPPWILILLVAALVIDFVSAWFFAILGCSFRNVILDNIATEAQISSSKASLSEENQSIQPAWELALGTLKQYWQRNARQNAFIFTVSVLAMLAGFFVLLLGAWGALRASTQPAVLASGIVSIAGVLTEFIGATFLLVYRSTMQQMTTFNATLERINSVGMAWYILQAVDDKTPEAKVFKDQTLARFALSIVGDQQGGNASVSDERTAGGPT
jgi:hypothetical protein